MSFLHLLLYFPSTFHPPSLLYSQFPLCCILLFISTFCSHCVLSCVEWSYLNRSNVQIYTKKKDHYKWCVIIWIDACPTEDSYIVRVEPYKVMAFGRNDLYLSLSQQSWRCLWLKLLRCLTSRSWRGCDAMRCPEQSQPSWSVCFYNVFSVCCFSIYVALWTFDWKQSHVVDLLWEQWLAR